MRVAIISPSRYPQNTGNAVTVRRIASCLRKNGIDVRVFLPDEKEKLIRYLPDIIHAFHAYKSGKTALEISQSIKIPYIVTITGTDGNCDLIQNPGEILHILENAKKISVFHNLMQKKLLKYFQNNATAKMPAIAIIPQSVLLEKSKMQARKNKKEFIFLLPAGIRPIKFKFCKSFKSLHEIYPEIKLLIAGPIIDQGFANNLMKEIVDKGWIKYCGELRHSKMFSLYLQSDVVLNCSESEGMPNSIMEAMSIGKAVLASDIEGNRALIRDNINGFLFKSPKEFLTKAKCLIESTVLRKKLGNNAQKSIKENFSNKSEIGSYMKLYQSIYIK